MLRYLTLRRLFELTVILGIAVVVAHPVTDPDFGWHLRTGEYILQTHSIPHTDPYSHTKLGAPWITHEWLSEVAMYLVYSSVSWGGLVCLVSACAAATFWFVLRGSEGRPYVAGLVLLLGGLATMPFWSVRPQIFTFLLASIFLYVLKQYRSTDGAAVLWYLPALMVIWVNLHGGFAFGLALIGTSFAAVVLDAAFAKQSTDRWKRVRRLGLVFLTCILAVAVNPNGARIYMYPLETLKSPSMQAYIQEWASPNFHSREMLPFAALLVATLIFSAASRRRASTQEIFLLALTAYAALNSMRHIPFFVLVAIPTVSASVCAFLEERRWRIATGDNVEASISGSKALVHAVLAVTLLAVGTFRLTSVLKVQAGSQSREMPVSAVNYIRQHHPPGPLFNDYDWGGYLIWQLYPEYRVFIDGRADVYGDRFLSDYGRTYRAEHGWKDELQRFRIGTVLLPPNAPLALLLNREPEWQLVFSDKQAVVFVNLLRLHGANSLASRH